MKQLLLLLLLVVGYQVYGQTEPKKDSVWVVVYSGDDFTAYYHKDRTKKIGTEITSWEKYVYHEPLKSQLISQWKKEDLKNASKYDLFSHTLIKYIFDCTNSKGKTLSIVNYDINGQVIYSENHNETAEWTDILPDSVAEAMLDHLCKKIK